MKNNHISLDNENFKNLLIKLYGSQEKVLHENLNRYLELAENFHKNFPDDKNNLHYFSSPGRTEIAGNHVDHQLGTVIASSVQMDILAACTPRSDNKVQFISQGYKNIAIIDLNDLEIKEAEKNHTASLIRGVAKGLLNKGYNIGGFNCYSTSNVPSGSGLSSSAAFEILLSTIFNYLYNNGNISPIEQAKIGQFAENKYFGKASGLLDQSACSIGGVISIDFSNKQNPEIKKLDLDLKDFGYEMIIVRTDKGHANLSDEYSAIPYDMIDIAKEFNKNVLREVDPKDFFNAIPILMKNHPHRAILRAIHFFSEEARTTKQINAIKNSEFKTFLEIVNDSGYSSETQLQNVTISGNPYEQEAALALALSRKFIKDNNIAGACRIHGGGFGGTIQTYIPVAEVNSYIEFMEAVYGKNSCNIIQIRPIGGIEL